MPAGQRAGSRLKKHLMIWILVTSAVLLGLISLRVWKIMNRKDPGRINVQEEAEAAFESGKGAGRDIFTREKKVWEKGEELFPDDFKEIQQRLKDLETCHARLKEILDLLRDRRLEDTPEHDWIVPRWLQVKLWILDASDLLDPAKKAPDYGGLFIRMYRTIDRSIQAQKELKELEKGKEDLLKESDPARRGAVVQRLRAIEARLGVCAEDFAKLDDYVKEGLARPDLSPRQIPDLETLRDEAARAGMVIKQARELRSQMRE